MISNEQYVHHASQRCPTVKRGERRRRLFSPLCISPCITLGWALFSPLCTSLLSPAHRCAHPSHTQVGISHLSTPRWVSLTSLHPGGITHPSSPRWDNTLHHPGGYPSSYTQVGIPSSYTQVGYTPFITQVGYTPFITQVGIPCSTPGWVFPVLHPGGIYLSPHPGGIYLSPHPGGYPFLLHPGGYSLPATPRWDIPACTPRCDIPACTPRWVFLPPRLYPGGISGKTGRISSKRWE